MPSNCFHKSLTINVIIRAIESVCTKLDIKLKESHKSILAILIPAIVFRDGSIIILSETIHQINRAVKKYNDKIDFVSILIGLNCISSIDRYGTITIPICVLLDRLKVKREIIGSTADKFLSKKVLTNATQTLYVSEFLQFVGIPKFISIPVINLLLEWINTDIENERLMMQNANVAFKGHKMSQIEQVLRNMHLEKIFLSTAILLIISEIGLKINSSLILVSIISELYRVLTAEYKSKTAKSFLN